MDRETMIASLKEYRVYLLGELTATDAALSAYGVGTDKPKAPAKAKTTSRLRGDGKPFAPKYDEPARVAATRILEANLPKGMGFGEIRDSLKKDGKEYADQALRAALYGEVKKGKLRKTKAPRDSPYKYLFFALGPSSGDSDPLS